MSVRPSSAKQIDTLIAALSNTDDVARDAAVARLTVIGARAVDRLLALAGSTAPPAARAAAFRALEGIADERALPAALQSVESPDLMLAQAAIAVARLSLRGARGADAVDRLTAVALDGKRPDAVRASAVRALRDLEGRTIRPLLKTLSRDTSATVRAAAGVEKSKTPAVSPADDPAAIRAWVTGDGATAPLTSLLDVVERARDREAAATPAQRADWATTRAAAHVALARRGSRIALYDVKESLEKSTAALPLDSLTALGLIGDTSCLEPIASAYTRTTDAWSRNHLLDAFHTIVKREKLTPRHAVMKRIAKKWKMA